jgi:broad specificity phosphatase PhoE
MLHLVRHGRTDANAQGLLLGRADPPLSEEGRRQAVALAGILPSGARVISSPLRRTRETAEAFGLDVEVDERWIELDYGPYDDRPPTSMPDDLWVRWRTDPAFTPPGVEPLAALGARVSAACEELSSVAASAVVVVVTHVSPVKAALAWALGVPGDIAWRLFVEDAAVSRIDVDDRGPVVRWFNRGR